MQIQASNVTIGFNTQGVIDNKEKAQDFIKDSFKKIGIEVSDKDLKNLNSKDISNMFFAQSLQISVTQFSIQGSLSEISAHKDDISSLLSNFQNLNNSTLGFNLSSLDANKARELVSEDGYWGAKQTAQRISDFVLNAAGDDPKKLQEGRRGILNGFNEAKGALGKNFKGGLSNLANDTIEQALKAIDEKLQKLGENLLNVNA